MEKPEPVPISPVTEAPIQAVPAPTNIIDYTPTVSSVAHVPIAVAPSQNPEPAPVVAATNISLARRPSVAAAPNVPVTLRPKSDHNKEQRSVKRLSGSDEDSFCAQSRTFRALEKLLLDEGDPQAL